MRSYKLFFLSMIALAALTGCEKEGNKKFDAVVDSIAGDYKVSSIYRDDGVAMDLNGDGIAHNNLLEEFDAMPGLRSSMRCLGWITPLPIPACTSLIMKEMEMN